MRIQVISDPIEAIGKDSYDQVEHWSDAARYDEEIIKPALLLADEVFLRSWRLDVIETFRTEGTAFLNPVPLVSRIVGAIRRNDPGELTYLRIKESEVHHLRARAKALGLLDGPRDSPSDYEGIQDLFLDPLMFEISKRNLEGLERMMDEFKSDPLETLTRQGIITQTAWDERPWMNLPESQYRRVLDPNGPDGSATYGMARIRAALSASEAQLLLDPQLVNSIANADHSITSDILILRNANELLHLVDELSTATLDELIDVRKELSPYLASFRSFILGHSRNFDLDPETSPEQLNRAATLYWDTYVEPELRELLQGKKSQSLRRNVVRVVTNGPDAAIGVGLGLAAALGSGAMGVSALAGSAVGALPVLIRAVGATLEAHSAQRTSGAYFLFEAKKRLGRRKG